MHSLNRLRRMKGDDEAFDPNQFAGGGEGQAATANGDQQSSSVITDINELDLQTESLEATDIAALEEALEYAPSIEPGKFHLFRFALNKERPVESAMAKGKMMPQFNYVLTHIKEDGTPGKEIRFNRATTFKSEKMIASRAEELLYSLGKLAEFNQTPRKASNVLQLLQAAEGEGRIIRGQVQWRHYDKETGTTISTNPAKPYKRFDKKLQREVEVVEQPWPRDAEGHFARHPGNEEVTRVLPTDETKEEMKSRGEAVADTSSSAVA